jgi:hypothetical protein
MCRRRGGRKLVITPDGTIVRPRSRIDSALVKALARGHRCSGCWRAAIASASPLLFFGVLALVFAASVVLRTQIS